MLKVGDKVRFLKDITAPACGDHPGILFAKAGETGVLVATSIATYKAEAAGFPDEFWVWEDEIESIKEAQS